MRTWIGYLYTSWISKTSSHSANYVRIDNSATAVAKRMRNYLIRIRENFSIPQESTESIFLALERRSERERVCMRERREKSEAEREKYRGWLHFRTYLIFDTYRQYSGSKNSSSLKLSSSSRSFRFLSLFPWCSENRAYSFRPRVLAPSWRWGKIRISSPPYSFLIFLGNVWEILFLA